MRKRFIACVACGRHVREGDESCPFCGAAASSVLPPRGIAPTRSVSRAAMLAAGAAGGILILVDCGNGNQQTQVFYGVACTGDACGFPEPSDAGDAGDAADGGDGGTGAKDGGVD